jgi:hypothetical protein
MSFWKLVAGIVVGNLITALLAAFLWQLLLPGMLTSFSSSDAIESYSNGQRSAYP